MTRRCNVAVCRSAVFVLGLLLAGRAGAIDQMLDLELLPTDSTTNRVTISVSASLLSDSEKTRVTGNSLATIGYDLYEGLPLIHSIAFTGGHISLLGESSDNITLSDSVFLLGSFDAVGSGLGGELNTPSPPGAVSNGTFNTAEHLVRVNAGTLDVEYTILGETSNYSLNLTQDPLDFTTTETATIDVSLASSNGLQRTFEVVTSLPVDATEVIEDGVTITVDVEGSVTASDTFTITLPLEGDYNSDGLVNIADYTVWRDTLGAAGPGLAADGNFDWVVDESDYSLWKDNFGDAAAGSLVAAASVPEPSAVMLLGAMALFLGVRRRRS